MTKLAAIVAGICLAYLILFFVLAGMTTQQVDYLAKIAITGER